MKHRIIILLTIISALIVCLIFQQKRNKQDAEKTLTGLIAQSQLQDGDIIFQTSQSSQSKAIQIATQSRYSHCGIIFHRKEGVMVLEAIQPVQWTPIQEWIQRGKHSDYLIKRLKDRQDLLTDSKLQKMLQLGNTYAGLDYDFQFAWTDQNLYCSELVWKLYQKATGISLCELHPLKDYVSDHAIVKNALKQRYGNSIPWEEMMVSPEDIAKSQLLKTVVNTYSWRIATNHSN